MPFAKGYTPFNKGKKLDATHVENMRGRTPWNKGKKGLQVAWNKGIDMPSMKGNQFSKGRTPWNKGKEWSEEVKLKISENSQGKKTGRLNPAWKGGVSESSKLERARFRKILQQRVLSRDNYTCQICDQYNGKLQVDHIKKWSEYPELRFDLDNCRTLCMACHYYVTFKRRLPQGVVWGHNFSRRTQ